MPNISDYSDETEWMGACLPKVMEENGGDREAAVGKCMGMWAHKSEYFGMTVEDAIKHFAAKYSQPTSTTDQFAVAVKAVGEWELDVNAVPFFSQDSDKQHFDPDTDIMPETFSTPLIVYQHGIQQGAKGYEEKPIKLGSVVPGSLKKLADGWHLRVILDKTIKQARDIWEAAKKGLVAVSSGSISHLARLDVGGKTIMYEKNRPGRISVWALAEVSLWETGNGNVKPANRKAYALPAMKAIYREAGLPFPDVTPASTYGALSEAFIAAKRAEREEIFSKAKAYLKQSGEE